MENSVLAKSQMREAILNLENDISWTDGALIGDNRLCPLYHYFTPGIYTREIRIPAGNILTGKIHKHQHPSFLLEGEVECATEENGIEHIKAPMLMISAAGTKRAIRTITDTIWVTVHHNPTNTTDLLELEQEIIAPSYEAFDKFIETSKQVKQIPQVTNCGLVALQGLCGIKNISVRTLINAAQDNGLELLAYNVPLERIREVPFPAIFHAENHFIYAENHHDLDGYNLTGTVISNNNLRLPLHKSNDLHLIQGATWVAAVVSGVGVGYKIYSDVRQKSQTKKEQKRLMAEQPAYETPDEFKQNKDLASYMAQRGLDEQSLQFYKTQNERNLANANQTALELGGGVNTINQNYESSLRGLGALAVRDSMMKADNLKLLMENNATLGGQAQTNWAINYKQWKDAMNFSNNQINAPNQGIVDGVTSLGSILGQSFSEFQQNKKYSGQSSNNNNDYLRNLGLDR